MVHLFFEGFALFFLSTEALLGMCLFLVAAGFWSDTDLVISKDWDRVWGFIEVQLEALSEVLNQVWCSLLGYYGSRVND